MRNPDTDSRLSCGSFSSSGMAGDLWTFLNMLSMLFSISLSSMSLKNMLRKVCLGICLSLK